jgi:predicted nucleic acid-binding protein
MNYVLDACALIALIKFEEGWEKVNALFTRAYSGEIMLYVSIVNLIEVFYGFIRSDGLEKASEILAPIYETPLVIIDHIPQVVYQEAARLKAVYKRISVADVIGLATAFDLSGTFVTSDGEILPIEQQEPIDISWFRPPKEKTK